MKDSYGVEIEEGDIVLSVATVSGNVKVGKIVRGRSGSLSLEHHTEIGYYWSKRKYNAELRKHEDNPNPIRTQLGSTNVVIRKADGTLTNTMEGILALGAPTSSNTQESEGS